MACAKIDRVYAVYPKNNIRGGGNHETKVD